MPSDTPNVYRTGSRKNLIDGREGHTHGRNPEMMIRSCDRHQCASSDTACDASQTFTEAEIRASVVFQLSELVSSLLKAARATAGSPEWDAMVSGLLDACTLGYYQNTTKMLITCKFGGPVSLSFPVLRDLLINRYLLQYYL